MEIWFIIQNKNQTLYSTLHDEQKQILLFRLELKESILFFCSFSHFFSFNFELETHDLS